jgi:hypothetical protein
MRKSHFIDEKIVDIVCESHALGVAASSKRQKVSMHAIHVWRKKLGFRGAIRAGGYNKLIARMKMAKVGSSYLKELGKLERLDLLITDYFGIQSLDSRAVPFSWRSPKSATANTPFRLPPRCRARIGTRSLVNIPLQRPFCSDTSTTLIV